MRVADLLRQKGEKVVQVRPGTPLADAMRLMAAEHVGTVLIIDDDDVLRGIISERDFIRIFTEHGVEAVDFPVCDLVRRSVITCHDDATLHDVMTLMSNNTIRHLPVVRDGHTVGMISARDVLDAQKQVLMRLVARQKQACNVATQAKERAELSDRHKTEFMHRVSHELRTPLNAIIGFSAMIESQSWGPNAARKYTEYAGQARSAGETLLGVINEILEMSRLEMGAWETQDQIIEVNGALEECIAQFRSDLDRKSIRLRMEPTPERMLVVADGYMVGQMLRHLVSNAVKFTPAGGEVDIRVAECEEGGLCITVGDTGRGIRPEAMAWITKPFSCGDDALKQNGEGAGLGLALTEAMIVLHGGALEIVSNPGAGTAATLRFPPERRRAQESSERRIA